MIPRTAVSQIDRIQSRLLNLAVGFLLLYAIGLTLSPAAVARNWQVDFLWGHWLGVAVWWAGFNLINIASIRWLPRRDAFIIPIAGLMCGWGLLTIWRLFPELGLRQSVWLMISAVVLAAGVRLYPELTFMRRYKYIWLTGSLVLTASTLIWGTNPLGYGPRMWLGCCGIYLQPSEPLKLMLIAYLAAYLADRQPFLLLSAVRPSRVEISGNLARKSKLLTLRAGLLPLLAPTLIMTVLALILLIIQRDLGTATIFLLLYATIIYIATGKSRIIFMSGIILMIAFFIGYWLFDVVQIRVEAWVNPFLDPSGRSYQIIQSLIAVANGEVLGRGPGIGYPNLVPVAHSDLIFTAIVEEQGLVGGIALVFFLAVFFHRGIRIALKASDSYRRFLAIGLTVFLAGQSILIICGGLRLLPLTGVTLPFMSYGGSSLLVSFLSLLFLLLISHGNEELPAPLIAPHVFRNLGFVFFSLLFAISLSVGWWSIFRGPAMLDRTDNPRRTISDLYMRRGSILDRKNFPIIESSGQPGEYVRKINYAELSNILGYTNPTYGQSGLEASLDGYLRGVQGNSMIHVWWNRLVFGFPPDGRDIRTSLDLELQQGMDQSLGRIKSAAVLINARTGEILALASHPTFNANQLEVDWEKLVADQDAPLLNRVIQGQYPLGELSETVFHQILDAGDFISNPQIRLPAGQPLTLAANQRIVNPLQVVLLAATISGSGLQPAPVLVTGIHTDENGWIILPPIDKPVQVTDADRATAIAEIYVVPQLNIWQNGVIVTKPDGESVTWYVGGTLPAWEGTSFAIAILLETNDLQGAIAIGQTLLLRAMLP